MENMWVFEDKFKTAKIFITNVFCVFLLFFSVAVYSQPSVTEASSNHTQPQASLSVSNEDKKIPHIKNTNIHEHVKSSVWKMNVIDRANVRKGVGSGFFISPNLFVTNFHVLGAIKHDNLDHINLSKDDNDKTLSIKRIVSLSAVYDLALFEVESEVDSFLQIREHSLDETENIFVTGYRQRSLHTMKATDNHIFYDENIYNFSVNYYDGLSGFSGGPVVDEQGQVVGIVFAGLDNYIFSINLMQLQTFIKEGVVLNCIDFVCIEQEIERLEVKAKQGVSSAQFSLAMVYKAGVGGIEENLEQAFYWYKQSAKQGHTQAQYNLASMYRDGIGVDQDLKKAFDLYHQIANQGYIHAQFNLSIMYRAGKGVEPDVEQAFYWYEQAAEQGHAYAQFLLANAYEFGEGVERDLETAFYWYEQSAKQGYADAQFHLAVIYGTGELVKENLEQALYWYEQAAEQGHDQAQFIIAFMYESGIGVEANLERAFYWYNQSAEHGYMEAQFHLAIMYESGIGVKANSEQALYWYKQAAEQGHTQAQLALDRLLTS
ncbi:MAG: bifunctional trypsin-like peptidase domain-containing/SEL1-like repeat protein [Bdellovibrionales bacterium]|nr:bifunctional trypsin-like peptidase domain-containing/SEL1-like repeat protein [Bdellovibrionales bacterium]